MSIVFKDFGTAYLAAPLAVGGLTITVDNPAALPILTNGDYFYLVLQKYGDRSYVEIVKVTATAGSTYTIQRGQAGTSVRAFAVGDYAELRLTVDGLTEYITQNIATKMDKSGGGDFSGIYRFLNPNVSRIDVVRTSDSAAASLVVDFSASEGHRTIVGGTTGSNVVTPSILLRPNGYGNGTGQVKIDSNGLVDVVGLNVRGQQGTDEGSVVRYGSLSNYVPTARKVNGHALSADFSITADEVFSAGATVNQRAVFQASDLQYKQADGAYGLRLAVSAAIAYLQGGKTDSALDDQKLYLSGWLGNPLSSFKVYADAVLIHRKSGVDYKIFDEANKPGIADVTGLSDALVQAGGNPVLSTAWVQLRTAMWNGYVAADGQLLKRADYPDAWAAIQAGKVPVTSDAAWLAAPSNRGGFSTGDGSTTFRVPDYNGKYAGSLGRVFLSGDGLNSAETNGVIQGDAIRAIKGAIGYFTADSGAIEPKVLNGAFRSLNTGTSNRATGGIGGVITNYGVEFDSSLVVPSAADNRPVNVTGCWAVKLFGAVQNAGSIDAAGLATQIAELQAPRPINSIDWQGGVAFRNLLLNGDFRIWQRGVSHDWTGSAAKFAADRWNVNFSAAGSASLTPEASRILGKASADISLVGKAAGAQFYMYQRLEDTMAWALRGKKATLSFIARASAPVTLGFTLHKPTSAYNDWTATTQLETTTFNVTTTAQRFSFTTNVLDGDKAAFGLQLMFNAVLGTGSLQITEIQFESGSFATPFECRPAGYELQLCKRYYQKYSSGIYAGSVAMWAPAAAGLAGALCVTPMRAVPTVVLSQGGVPNRLRNAGNNVPVDITGASFYAHDIKNGVISGIVAGGNALAVGAMYDFDMVLDAEL